MKLIRMIWELISLRAARRKYFGANTTPFVRTVIPKLANQCINCYKNKDWQGGLIYMTSLRDALKEDKEWQIAYELEGLIAMHYQGDYPDVILQIKKSTKQILTLYKLKKKDVSKPSAREKEIPAR